MNHVRRLPRGTRIDPVATPWVIERASKDRLAAIARNAGMSAGALLELVIARLDDDLTDRGVPSWLPQPKPDEGELPIEPA